MTEENEDPAPAQGRSGLQAVPEDFGEAEKDFFGPTPGKKYEPDKHREYTRIFLACGIFVLLFLVLIIPIWRVTVNGVKWNEVQGIVGATIPGVFGIAGTILGFYFGRQEHK